MRSALGQLDTVLADLAALGKGPLRQGGPDAEERGSRRVEMVTSLTALSRIFAEWNAEPRRPVPNQRNEHADSVCSCIAVPKRASSGSSRADAAATTPRVSARHSARIRDRAVERLFRR